MKLHEPFAEAVKIDAFTLARLMPDEDLFKGLSKIAKDQGIERGVVISAIGSLKDVVFRNPKSNVGLPVRLEKTNETPEAGPMELLSLEGNIFPSEGEDDPIIHLHGIFGSPSGAAIGGHLLRATVFTTVEIILARIVGSSSSRAKSDVTGLMELLKK